MMEASSAVSHTVKTIDLKILPLEPETFAAFGQVIKPAVDGTPFGPDDAQLELSRGVPRFYILPLMRKERTFRMITRHLSVTQCLVAMGGKSWLIAVAPPNDPDDQTKMPDPTKIKAFRIPGNLGIKLHRSAWHAGPFTDGEAIDFMNLELSDTNQVDHFSCHLDQDYGMEFRFVD
jgi:ureidoglycolate hydrolase